jgi:hypothetical protein
MSGDFGDLGDEALAARVRRSERPLFLGIGGGGDVVGALAVAKTLAPHVSTPLVGGLTWERRPVDPVLRPRRLDEVDEAERLNLSVAWATFETSGPNGFKFAESRLAGCLGHPTLLVDPSGGAERLGGDLADAALALGSDLVVIVDVGGDVLAEGNEPSLISPLCDAICLAATPALSAQVDVVGVVVGAGCDGELTLDELSGRLGLVATAGDGLEALNLSRSAVDTVAEVVAEVETEASRFMLECARGATGIRAIRNGVRHVCLSPYGSIVFLFDPLIALKVAAPLARAAVAGDFFDAAAAIRALGARTEIDPGDQRPLLPMPSSLNVSSTFGRRWLQAR